MNLFENVMKILMSSVVCLVVQSSEGSYGPDYLDFGLQKLPSEHLNRVLVCLKTENQLTELTKIPKHTEISFTLIDSFPELNIEFHLFETCQLKIEQEQKNIVAVIAPKPLPFSSDIPMYFFDTAYLDSEDDSEEIPKYFFDNRYQTTNSKDNADVDAFPNGLFPLRGNWHSLKYALSHFLTIHGWKRIAIISDDSYYSQAFERKLVEHLKKEDFVYNVQRCVTTRFGCHFDRAMRYLKRSKTYIIIANIQGVSAKNLANTAQSFQMVSNRYVWLVRDWPFENDSARMFKQMVSLTLSPLEAPDYKLEYGGPHLNSVWRGLALVSHAIKNTEKKERIEDYHESLYNIMNDTNKCDRSRIFIRRFRSGDLIDMHSTVIHNSGLVEPYPKDMVMAEKNSDLSEFCLQRSKSFENPCNDTWIVAICVVWLMFIIMVVLSVYFFNRCLVWT